MSPEEPARAVLSLKTPGPPPRKPMRSLSRSQRITSALSDLRTPFPRLGLRRAAARLPGSRKIRVQLTLVRAMQSGTSTPDGSLPVEAPCHFPKPFPRDSHLSSDPLPVAAYRTWAFLPIRLTQHGTRHGASWGRADRVSPSSEWN